VLAYYTAFIIELHSRRVSVLRRLCIHPNAAGARMIASTILPFVRPLTGVSTATR
jgi:hypothetical protein